MSVGRLITPVIARFGEKLTALSGLLVSTKKVPYCADESLEIEQSRNMSLEATAFHLTVAGVREVT
jgi:hypothetical protein